MPWPTMWEPHGSFSFWPLNAWNEHSVDAACSGVTVDTSPPVTLCWQVYAKYTKEETVPLPLPSLNSALSQNITCVHVLLFLKAQCSQLWVNVNAHQKRAVPCLGPSVNALLSTERAASLPLDWRLAHVEAADLPPTPCITKHKEMFKQLSKPPLSC